MAKCPPGYLAADVNIKVPVNLNYNPGDILILLIIFTLIPTPDASDDSFFLYLQFSHKNKLKSEIFNDKKIYKQKLAMSTSQSILLANFLH